MQTRIQNFLARTILPLLIALVAAQVWACRNLFVDGSNFLVSSLALQNFSMGDPARMYARYMTQLPLVAAIKAGVTHKDTLIYLHGLGLMGMPVLIWGLALFRLRRHALFWPFAMMFCVVYFSICFTPVSESHMAYALSAFCLALMLSGMGNKYLNYPLLLAAAILLTHTYETAFLLAPLLAVLALSQIKKVRGLMHKGFWLAVAIVFVWTVYINMQSLLSPMEGKHFEYVAGPSYPFSSAQPWICALVAGLTGLGALLNSERARRVAFIAACLAALSLLLPPLQSSVLANLMFRAFISVFMSGYFIALIWLSLAIDADKKGALSQRCRSPYVALPAFLLLAVLSLNDMGRSAHYHKFTSLIRQEVNTRSGIIRFEDTALNAKEFDQYMVMWTPPSLSILFRKSEKGAVIRVQESWAKEWQPFLPEHTPDLSRYYEP